jgi:hypothetical protein
MQARVPYESTEASVRSSTGFMLGWMYIRQN